MFKEFFLNIFKPARLVGQRPAEAPKGPEADMTFEDTDVITPSTAKKKGGEAISKAGKVHSDLVDAEREDRRQDAKEIGKSLHRAAEGTPDESESKEVSEKRELIRKARQLKAKIDKYNDFTSEQVRDALYKDGDELMSSLYKAGSVKYSELANFAKYKNLEARADLNDKVKTRNAGIAKVMAMGAPIPSVG